LEKPSEEEYLLGVQLRS